MTTIITRHYPASKLPEELREGIDPSSLVTVTIIQRAISPQEAAGDRDEIDIDSHRRGNERDE
jgi:hypothetical protein